MPSASDLEGSTSRPTPPGAMAPTVCRARESPLKKVTRFSPPSIRGQSTRRSPLPSGLAWELSATGVKWRKRKGAVGEQILLRTMIFRTEARHWNPMKKGRLDSRGPAMEGPLLPLAFPGSR